MSTNKDTSRGMDNGELFTFEILGMCKPSVNGKDTYQRLLIRRIPPKEKVFSICRLCGLWKTDRIKCENCEVEVIVEDACGPNGNNL
jgi:hypothetical protein